MKRQGMGSGAALLEVGMLFTACADMMLVGELRWDGRSECRWQINGCEHVNC